MMSQSSIGLTPQRETVHMPGRSVRVHRKVESETFRDILRALKPTGYSISLLCEAANILATMSFNESISDDDVFVHDLSM